MAAQDMPFIEFAVEDADRALGFYGSSFNWSYFQAPSEHPYFVLGQLDGPSMAGVLPVAFAPQTLVFFPTTDLEATTKRIDGHGGRVIESHAEEGLGAVAQWKDPYGNRFGLTETTAGAPLAHVSAERVAGRPARNARKVAAQPAYAEIAVDDAEEAVDFYASVFGWNAMRAESRMEYWVAGEPGRPAFAAIRPVAFAPRVIPYLHTANLKSALARIKKNGGLAFEARPQEGVGAVAECKDPDGNAFGLVQFGDNVAATKIRGGRVSATRNTTQAPGRRRAAAR